MLRIMAGSYGKTMFSSGRHCQTTFQSDCAILHSHEHWMRVPVAPHPHQHLVLSVFWVLVILIDVWWYLTTVLICISLVTYDMEHIFICFVAFSMSSLMRCLFGSCTHFWIRFIFLLWSFKNSLYILDNSPLSDVSFADVFIQSVACLLIHLRVFFLSKLLNPSGCFSFLISKMG